MIEEWRPRASSSPPPPRSRCCCWAARPTPTPSAASTAPVSCPRRRDPNLVERARAAKAALGDRVFILGHHYQRDEVIQFADVTGDSLQARARGGRPARRRVHRLLRRPLHGRERRHPDLRRARPSILPDLAAGCSMADMADDRRRSRTRGTCSPTAGIADVTIPITYMNSTAAIKAFCGRHGGAVCTSSNAGSALEWAFEQGEKVLFLPDQHLGRNTAVLDLGLTLDDCVVYDPHRPGGGLTADAAARREGHPVEGPLLGARPLHRRDRRPRFASASRVSTCSCTPSAGTTSSSAADLVGSTEFIIKTLEAAPAGQRLGDRHRAQPGQAARPRPPGQAGSSSSTGRSASARR